MLILKDLYIAVNDWLSIEANGEDGHDKRKKMKQLLEKSLNVAKEYLTTTKTFEYTGKLEMNGGNVIKLTDIATDLDDVMQALNGGKRQVDLDVCLYLVVYDKPEVKEEAKVQPVNNYSVAS